MIAIDETLGAITAAAASYGVVFDEGGMMQSALDVLLRSNLEMLAEIDLAYLYDHPETSALAESEVWKNRSQWNEVACSGHGDVKAVLDAGRGDAVSIVAWRAAELLRQWALLQVRFRRVDGAIQPGLALVWIPKSAGVPNKVRRRIRRLAARARRGELFVEDMCGVPVHEWWYPEELT